MKRGTTFDHPTCHDTLGEPQLCVVTRTTGAGFYSKFVDGPQSGNKATFLSARYVDYLAANGTPIQFRAPRTTCRNCGHELWSGRCPSCTEHDAETVGREETNG